jgi:hypothetical protein
MTMKPPAYADGDRRAGPAGAGGMSVVTTQKRPLYQLPELLKRGIGGTR